ncbi:MAG: gliding motility protein SprB [Bacteroidota bacterium]|jgi:gliding motility-associated-like protein
MQKRIFILLLLLFITKQEYCFAKPLITATSNFNNRPVHKGINSFFENIGQLKNEDENPVNDVILYSKNTGLDFFVTTHGITYVLHKRFAKTITDNKDSCIRIDVKFIDASIKKENIEWLNPTDELTNFYTEQKSFKNITSYRKIVVRDIYPNINWIIEQTDSSLKFSYQIAANADASKIKFEYNGAEDITIDEQGYLLTNTKIGSLAESKVLIKQQEKTIVSGYRINYNQVSFNTTNIDTSTSYIIDPILIWTTFFGGEQNDVSTAVCTDKQDNFYVTGYSQSVYFPIKNAGTYFAHKKNYTDAFISKFNKQLKLTWSTFFGGNADDKSYAIKCDINDNVFICGSSTSTKIPIFNNGLGYLDSVNNDNYTDGMLAKFSSSGSLLFSTFIGDSLNDELYDLDIRNGIHPIIVGSTNSKKFPTKNKAAAYNQSALNFNTDGVVMEFDNNGAMLWSSYVGGNSSDALNSVSTDGAGNFYAIGTTSSTIGLPLVNSGFYYNAVLNVSDAIVVKFSNSNSLAWSTLLGGSNNESGNASAIDSKGNLYVAGSTNSLNFPIKYSNQYIDSTLNNGITTFKRDAYLSKFSTSGNLEWSTLKGGDDDDFIDFYTIKINDVLVIDNCNNVYFSYATSSKNEAVINDGCNSYFDNNFQVSPYYSGQDAFLCKFNKYGTYMWGTYYGGTDSDNPFSMALNKNSDVLASATFTTGLNGNIFITNPSGAYFSYNQYISSYYNQSDAMLLKFEQPKFNSNVTYSNCGTGCSASAAVVVNATCNKSNFSYLWSNNTHQINTNSLCNGTYSVIVSDSIYCTSDTVFFTIKPNSFNAVPSISKYSCPATCNGSASISVPNLSGLGYEWHTVDTILKNISTVHQLCPGWDTVIVTSVGCGSDTIIFNIPPPPQLSIQLNGIDNGTLTECPLSCKGAAEVVLIGGEKTPTCVWSNGDFGTFADSLCIGGSYIIMATDSVCYNTFNFISLPHAPKPTAYLNNILPTSKCKNTGFTSVYISNTISNAVHYKWSNGDTLSYTDSLAAGNNYCVITIDTCFYDSIPFFVPKKSLSAVLNVPAVLACSNSANCVGHAYASPTGTAPYTYLWNTGSTLNQIDSICPGQIVSVKIKDACNDSITLSSTFSVIVAGAPSIISINYTYSCSNPCIGKAFLNVTGGITPYTFNWNNHQTTQMGKNLCPDSIYTVIVTDKCNKSDTITFKFPKAKPIVLNVTSTSTCNSFCLGTATVQNSSPLSPQGGVPPYTYLWSNGQTTAMATGLCTSTNYFCIVTDACGINNGITTTIGVANNLSISLGSSGSCLDACFGTAYVNVNGGMPPFTFTWNDGTSGQTYFNACANTYYKCTVTDACGSSITDSILVPLVGKAIGNFTIANNNCSNQCNAYATLNLTGGVPPYFFRWNDFVFSQTHFNLCPDSNYYCIATSVGCGSDTFSLKVNKIAPLTIDSFIIQKSCNNICNGSATVFVSNGTAPYTYKWSNGGLTDSIMNVCLGNYNCIIKDACNVADTFYVSITATDTLKALLDSIYNPICSNSCKGKAIVKCKGGRLPYLYSWNNSISTYNNTTLCSGNIYCNITDVCLQKDSVFATITNYSLPQLYLDSSKKSCINTCNGKAFVHANGGLKPYSFLWNNAQLNATVNNLCLGSNYCIVTDGCGIKDTILVQTKKIDSLSYTLNYQASLCKTPCSGNAVITVNGGMKPYTYLWSNGINTNHLDSICSGNYNIMVTNKFCVNDTLIDSFTIQTNFITQTHIISNPICNDSCNGIAAITPLGGKIPYHYNWGNGFKPDSINKKLCSGTFIITSKDANNCISIDTIHLQNPLPIGIDTNFIFSHCFNKDGSIHVNAKYGTAPYYYLWSNGETLPTLYNIAKGLYYLQVSDSKNCKHNFALQLNAISPAIYVSHDTLVGTGQLVKLIASGTKYYTWQPSNNLSCDSCSATIWNGILTQKYCVIGTDEWQCTDTACVTITTFDECGSVQLPNAFSPNNDGIDDVFMPIYENIDCIKIMQFNVFDRWGNNVFTTDDKTKSWNGTFHNQPMPIDTYVWTLHVENYFGRTIFLKGDVILIK